MTDLNELKQKGLLTEGNYLRVMLKGSQRSSDGILSHLDSEFLALRPLESSDQEMKEAMEKMFDGHSLKHVIINKRDIKYIAVMEKIESTKTNNEQ